MAPPIQKTRLVRGRVRSRPPPKGFFGRYGSGIGMAVAITLILLLTLKPNLTGPVPPRPAPDFTIHDVRAWTNVTLSGHRGHVVLLDFMATWCTTCIYQSEELRKLASVRPAVVIVSIDTDPSENEGQLRDWIVSHGANWTHGFDPGGVSVRYRVIGLPTLVIVDRDGQIRYIHEAATSAARLREETDGLAR